MFKFIGLLLLAQVCLSKRRRLPYFTGDEAPEQPDTVISAPEPDTPIVNNQPDIVPINDNNDNINDESWFEHKYIVATLDKHFILVMGIIGVIFVSLVVCMVWNCQKRKGKIRPKGYEYDGVDEDTETELDVEKQPINA